MDLQTILTALNNDDGWRLEALARHLEMDRDLLERRLQVMAAQGLVWNTWAITTHGVKQLEALGARPDFKDWSGEVVSAVEARRRGLDGA